MYKKSPCIELFSDGYSNSSSKINDAISEINMAGTGCVLLSSPLYVVSSKIIMKTGVYLYSPNKSIIFNNSGGLTNIIEGEGFLDLTGTNSGSGISNFGISNIKINGNRSVNTVGGGIAIYGRDFLIEDVYLLNIPDSGLITEYGNGSVGTSPFNGQIRNLNVDTCGKDGWSNKVSDLHADSINVKSAGLKTDNTYSSIYLGNSGGIRGNNINVWSAGYVTSWAKYAMLCESSGNCITNTHLETGKSANLKILGDNNQISNLYSYDFKGDTNLIVCGSGNRVQAICSRGPVGIADSYGLVLGTATDSAFNNDFDVYINDHNLALVDMTYSTGANTIHLSGAQQAGTLITGWTSSTDLVYGRVSGAVSSNFFGGRGARSIQIGSNASCSAIDGLAFGNGCKSSGSGSIAVGNQSSTPNSNSVALGTNCSSGAIQTFSLGNRAKATVISEIAFASFMRSVTGDRQKSTILMAIQTTDNTATELSCLGSGTSRCVLDDSSVYKMEVSLMGVNIADLSEVFQGTYTCGIKKDTTSASTAFVGSGLVSVLDAANPAGWAVAISADTTNGALKILVTGANSKTIEWFAKIETIKIV